MEHTSARPPDYLEQMLDHYGNMLYRICLVTLGNESDAEDAVQETFMKLLQKTPEFVNPDHEKAWLITVASNKCKDIFRWDGAVVGTSYEQATEELKVEITEVKDVLTVRVEMLYPEQAPYGFMETFGISQYKIVDADGKVIVKNAKTEMTELAGDTVLLEIPVEKCTGGKYQLLVESFVGGAKADQPLEIHGAWSCEFVR